MFEVHRVGKSFRNAVPRRIQAIRPFKAIGNANTNWMKEQAYTRYSLDEYLPCWTGEMASRPIPFVSTDSKPLKTQQAVREYIDDVIAFLTPNIKPGVQSINKISSLGYPIDCNPGDGIDIKTGLKRWQSKFDVTMELFERMQAGDFEMYKHGYHTIGVRKQNEPPTKVREFQFITASGEIYQREVSGPERTITVPELGDMVGSRTRTITRPPVVNLWLQCWDTMMHGAIMHHPLCDANVYVKSEFPSDAHFKTFDCKHYERYMGLAAIEYARAIGGVYEREMMQMIEYPFIVPSDDWTEFFSIRPLYRAGVYPQFSSGLSSVAPLGKLTNICVQVKYFTEELNMPRRDAIATVMSGSSPGLRRWMYGDDNRCMGDPVQVDAFCAFMGEHFVIEFDDVPKYLGTIFRRDIGRWVLPASTYQLKLYQPERDYDFKDYPNLGMVERRATFTEYGEPEIASSMIPFEDTLWNAVDHPFVAIAAAAIIEREKARRKGIDINKYLATDKGYLMSESERIASGMFWNLSPPVVAWIGASLVGDRVKKQLTFANAAFAPVPKPDRGMSPYQQDQEAQADEKANELYATETVETNT